MAQSRLYDAAMSPNKMVADGAEIGSTKTDDGESSKTDDFWLLVARDAYIQSSNYFDANIRQDVERNMAHFSNQHAPGSKYFSDAYKHRHKGFRPKTRSMVRRNEAKAAISMFSTHDSVHIKASRSNHPSHRISAEINQSLLQYRLDNTIPWFQTVIGAYQDTMNTGICISHQYWDYQELAPIKYKDDLIQIGPDNREVEPRDEQFTTSEAGTAANMAAGKPDLEGESDNAFDKFDGFEVKEEIPVILKDTPAIELRPIENVFFSVACDWRDPANTSPFIIDKIPMTIDDIKAMAEPSTGTKIPWIKLTESQLLTGVTADYDPVRRQREGGREDSKDQRHLHRGFDIAWVHRNIIRKDGRDWVYYTLGIYHRLSNPIPLEEEYPWLKPGERPYVIGFSNLEAHKNYPAAIVGLAAKTQQEANEINNQRRDNVALVLNRRYIVKRSANIDYAGLQRNVPGGVTETDDPTNDIRMEAPQDVTQSSYQEQDRVNADFDELTGTFSSGSVNTNKNLNETVGGMELLSGDADELSEYPLRTFVVTWVEPVLKQFIRLEQEHESDGALLNLMGEKLKLWHKHGINRITDAWIQGSMNLEVNVGFGATNPQKRVQKIALGLQTILQFAPQLAAKLDAQELAKEVLGALGFAGADRFFPEKQPQEALPQGPKDGDVTEQDQAKLDQDQTQHEAAMQQKERQMQWEIEKFYAEMENKEKERLIKKELSDVEFQLKMAQIQKDRQNAVDEMKIKLKMGTGI
ncbi:MAG: hypothetical protein V3R76_00255 [Gammaproteobacteria bacterium]